jgi:hypothetical protein
LESLIPPRSSSASKGSGNVQSTTFSGGSSDFNLWTVPSDPLPTGSSAEPLPIVAPGKLSSTGHIVLRTNSRWPSARR